MAIGLASDFKVYNEQIEGGFWEGLAQNVNVFNGASANTIRLVTEGKKGEYALESFFKSITDITGRRDTTAVTAATDLAMTEDENISVKLSRFFGPVTQTWDAWKKTGRSQEEMSFMVGQFWAEEVLKDYLNLAMISIEAALEGQATLVYDATGQTTKTLTHEHMIKGMAKRGDMAEEIAAFVGHSKAYYDLVGDSIADQAIAFQIGGFTIFSATAASFGRPFIVTDSPALYNDNGSLTDTYNTLGLVPNAVVVTESESKDLVADVVTGLLNLVMRFQGEYALNIGCRGFKWDVASGQENPTDATLGTTTNWDLAVTSVKQAAGVRILTQ